MRVGVQLAPLEPSLPFDEDEDVDVPVVVDDVEPLEPVEEVDVELLVEDAVVEPELELLELAGLEAHAANIASASQGTTRSKERGMRPFGDARA